MKKPSQRMNINSSNLLDARNTWRTSLEKADVPYIQRQMFDVIMTAQMAQIERLDALLELVEHVVVDHICDHEQNKQPGEKPKTDGLNEFLDGLGPREPKEE